MATLLYKNNRVRVKEKKRLMNLIKHLLRHYNDNTMKYKNDFHHDKTQHNIVVDENLNREKQGENWHSETEKRADDIHEIINSILDKAESNQGIIKADELSIAEKKAIRKSIKYFANLSEDKLNPKEQVALSGFISECKAIQNQSKKEKDYTISKDAIATAQAFFNELDRETKVVSLKAKKNNLKKISDNIEKMNNRHVAQNNAAKANSILIQEQLFKIPKHNEKGLKPSIILEIMHDWHNKHFSDYDVVGGFLHRDERTKKGNTVDDHYHFVQSGYSNKTKSFDITEHSFKLGLKLAKERNINADRAGIEIDIDQALETKYNKTTERYRVFAGEVLQQAFYEHANEILKKHNVDYSFERKELTREEKELRRIIAKDDHKPKSKKKYSMAGFYEEEKANFLQEINDLKSKIESLNEDNRQLLIDKRDMNNEYTNTIDNLNDIYEDSLKFEEIKEIVEDFVGSIKKYNAFGFLKETYAAMKKAAKRVDSVELFFDKLEKTVKRLMNLFEIDFSILHRYEMVKKNEIKYENKQDTEIADLLKQSNDKDINKSLEDLMFEADEAENKRNHFFEVLTETKNKSNKRSKFRQ
ncbi:hypothetical protein CO725_13685 [Vibrio parahaemolyticus]|uniref:hypothetical protein n=1 Tax=Vibrio parahaemolyticus TaxID=670 RepID=UPI000BE48E5D|nr:hypothetical protein [Vibrio parahaemolyticus]ATI46683.1 hypothetical protein CO725_13685 [Vibrio parahaemolyticus]